MAHRVRTPPEPLIIDRVGESVRAAHECWKREPKATRLPFRIHLARDAHDAYVVLLQNPAHCLALPLDVQRALRPPRGRKLGQKTLEQYMPLISERFLALPEPRPKLEVFIEGIRTQCTTEGELQRFLGVLMDEFPKPPTIVR